MNIDVNVVPKYFDFCVKSDCPLVENCLRFQAAESVMESGATTLKILNLKNLAKNEGDACTWYKPAERKLHGKGILKFLASLTVSEHKRVMTILEGAVSSSRQFYRYRNGEKTVEPELQELMNQRLRAHGIEKEVFFDEIIETYNF